MKNIIILTHNYRSYAEYWAIAYRFLNLLLLGCGLLLSSAAKVHAEPQQSEQMLRNDIAQVVSKRQLNPEQRLSQLRKLQSLAIEQMYQEAEIEAAAAQAYEYAISEDMQKSLEVSANYLALAQEKKLHRAAIWLLSSKLRYHTVKNDFDTSHAIQVTLFEMLNVKLNADDHARALYEIALSEHQMDMHQPALIHLKSAQKLTSDVPNSLLYFDIMSLFGSIYSATGHFKEAINAFQRVIRIHEKSEGSDWERSIILYNLGDVYLLAGQYQQAEKSLASALSIGQKLNDEIGIAYVLFRLADLATKRSEHLESVKLANAAKQTFLKTDDYHMAIKCGLVEAKALILAERYQIAEQRLEEMKPWVDAQNLGQLTADHIHTRYLLAKAQKNYQVAIRYLETSSEYKLDLERKKHEEGVRRTLAELNVELTESENRYLQQQDELNLERLERAESEREVLLLSTISIAGGFIAVGFVLFNQISSKREYEHLAMRDSLTKAFNRRAIMIRAEKHFRESVEQDLPFTVGLIDLDNFKRVNDIYGHDVGDEVLKVFADVLPSAIRKHDRFGRYGGEEWIVLFPETSIYSIHYVFDRLQERLRKLEIKGLPADYRIACSMGAAERNPNTDSLDEMIKQADRHLYKAKELGKDQLVAISDERE